MINSFYKIYTRRVPVQNNLTYYSPGTIVVHSVRGFNTWIIFNINLILRLWPIQYLYKYMYQMGTGSTHMINEIVFINIGIRRKYLNFTMFSLSVRLVYSTLYKDFINLSLAIDRQCHCCGRGLAPHFHTGPKSSWSVGSEAFQIFFNYNSRIIIKLSRPSEMASAHHMVFANTEDFLFFFFFLLP